MLDEALKIKEEIAKLTDIIAAAKEDAGIPEMEVELAAMQNQLFEILSAAAETGVTREGSIALIDQSVRRRKIRTKEFFAKYPSLVMEFASVPVGKAESALKKLLKDGGMKPKEAETQAAHEIAVLSDVEITKKFDVVDLME
jgi:hypothetical protein